MADLYPPWTIDSLDNLKASLDDLTLTLDSPLYETTVTRWDAAGSVSCSASVSASGQIIQTGTAAVTCTATVTAAAGIIQTASAAITANGTLEANAEIVKGASAQITADASVSASCVVTYGGFASIEATATVQAGSDVLTTGTAHITCTATVTAKGSEQGEEWTEVTFDTTTWTPVPAGGGSWALRV